MKKIGLVLAGGGGRGAYHIGVWKALRETGLAGCVSAISGTSVGGLNAALFLQGDYEKAVQVWENISVEKILTPRHGFGNSIQHSKYEPKKYHGIYLYIRDGLTEIIRNSLDMSVFDNSSKNCYMTCRRTQNEKDMESYLQMFTKPDGTKACKRYFNGKAVYFNMREYAPDQREKILLATSALPFIFPKEKIDGYYYMDGGSADNLPVEPLYRLEKCEIIVVVHLTTNDRLLTIKKEDFPGALILEIRPKQEQGGLFAGILDFTAEGAKRRIQQGYDDTIMMFRSIRDDIDLERVPERQWPGRCRNDNRINTEKNAIETRIKNM